MKKFAFIVFVFLSLFFGAAFFLKFQKENEIPLLTQEERVVFGKMWETLYYDANFGYTLIGSKPVSTQNWSKDALNLSPNTFSFFLDGQTRKLWEQFSNKHPSSYYALIFKDYILPKTIDSDELIIGEVILINKIAVKNFFLQHKNLITKKLSFSDHSPESIVNEIFNSHNHELNGLILGFGPHNSNFFQREYDLRAYYKNGHYVPHNLELNKEEIQFLKEIPAATIINQIDLDPKNIALELQQRHNTPFDTLESYVTENPLSMVPLPCFRAVQDHPETLTLIEKYQNEQKKIVQFGLSKSLLDSILHVYFFGVPNE